jgi:hypothetical protein
LLLGLLLAQSPKIARQWERAVVLRLGKYVGLRGPGLFWIIPFVDSISGVDRSAGDYDRLRRGRNLDERHGSRERRCSAFSGLFRIRKKPRSKCRTTRRR